MASTYVNDLRLEEITTGEQSGSWGTTTNTNLELISEAFSYGSEAIADASTHTITVADGASDEARSFYMKCTGGGQACTVTLAPSTLSKVWIVENATSYTLTFSQSGSGANVAVAAGQVKMIATDGGSGSGIVYDLLTDLSAAGDLFVANTLNVAGDTAAGDNAAIGYTSAEGLILCGQGSTSDVTLKNDADATVFTVPTGTDDILFPDSAKAMFGAGSDLQIYHDGSNSYVEDAGTGILVLKASQLNINSAGDESMAVFAADGAVTLYHNNAAKLATASGGISVTGEVAATSLDISGDADIDGTLETDALSIASTTVTSTAAELNILDGVTSTAAELNLVDGSSAGSIVNSKAVIYSSAGVVNATDVAVSGSGNRSVAITSTDGIGSIEIGSYAGNQAFIDLKTPSSDDFDVRLASDADGTGGSLTSQAMVIDSPSTTGAGIFTATVQNNKSDNSTVTNGLKVRYGALSPGDSNLMFQCVDAGGTTRFSVANNGTLANTSDRKLKENIVNSSDKLTDLCKIKIRDFNWKESREKTKQIGWIAQEVQEVFPEMVFEDSGNLAVKHSEFVPILIKSVQEQQVIIEGLLKRIEALES